MMRLLLGTIFFGIPPVMIYAAGMHMPDLFFGAWIGGSLVGGLLAKRLEDGCWGIPRP